MLVGVASWSRGGGKMRGHRASGVASDWRGALSTGALGAVIRHDGGTRRFYDRLRERGNPENVSVVAVMRKILMQLNAVARRGMPWVPQAGQVMALRQPDGYQTRHYRAAFRLVRQKFT